MVLIRIVEYRARAIQSAQAAGELAIEPTEVVGTHLIDREEYNERWTARLLTGQSMRHSNRDGGEQHQLCEGGAWFAGAGLDVGQRCHGLEMEVWREDEMI
jgi:hypothetical protein